MPPQGRGARFEHGGRRRYTRVVDQYADVTGGGSGTRDGLCARHVQGQRDDAGVGYLDGEGVAGSGVHLGHPAPEQLLDVMATHAPTGAGDEDGLVRELSHTGLQDIREEVHRSVYLQ